jgi:hypothetical protein
MADLAMPARPDNTVPEPSNLDAEARDLRALLEVVLDAITLPYGTHDYDRRMRERASWVRTTVRAALDESPTELGWNVDFLRSRMITEQAEADERAKNSCGRCYRPFDASDTRFDGRARHKATPFCRWCTDNCADGGTEHVCVICEPKRYGGAGR